MSTPEPALPVDMEGDKRTASPSSDKLSSIRALSSHKTVRTDTTDDYRDGPTESFTCTTSDLSSSATTRPKPVKLRPDQVYELKESFALFDKAGEDMIGAGEVATALRAMGQNPTEAECCQMLGEVDLNEQGRVSLDEFLRVVSLKGLKNEPEMEEDLEEALRVFDKDGTGLIEAEELKTVLKTLGERLEEEDVNDLLKTADVDKDGRINYQDFVQKIVGK